MTRLVYTLLLILAAPLLLVGLYKNKPNKPAFGSRWKEHFGVTPPLRGKNKPIWIHAVSVGEAIAVTPVIQRLKLRNPQATILVTTTTSTGAEQIAKLGELVEHRYMPLDFPFAIKHFIKSANPSQLIIMETELWPNTLHYVAQQHIPITVINARLSERSMQRYQKVPAIFKLIAANVDHFLCQNQDDASRFIALGAAKNEVTITGSVKFDISISDSTLSQGEALRQRLGINRPVWIAASTHKGEDEIVLAAHNELLKCTPDALLILVPRHPERFNDVAVLARREFNTVIRTSAQPVTADTQVYIGDTMGEMLILMAASDLCFMGGSLLGNKVGGHNLLEPSALGLPSITGPSYFNFLEITNALIGLGVTQVCSENTIADIVKGLINDSQLRSQLSVTAKRYLEQQKGALEKTVIHIERVTYGA